MKYIKEKDLIIGKWYGGETWRKGSFAKFSKIDGGVKFSESYFPTRGYENYNTGWFSPNKFFEIPLATLKKHLPEDHPDLQSNNNNYELY